MKFKIDHDYHIHSQLSLCSKDPEQTAENILKYAERNHFTEIVVTDHFWDSAAGAAKFPYDIQNYAHISSILELPQSNQVKFRFGCETELDKDFRLGITEATMDRFDFIVIPTTHMHMPGLTISEDDLAVERKAYLYIKRLNHVMSLDLPFYKIGIAHLTCQHIGINNWEEHLAVLDLIPDQEFEEAFAEIARKGAGFELNFTPGKYKGKDLERVLRPYRIAKAVGCKFYLGSDSHHPDALMGARNRFETIAKLLELKETDRFYIP